MAAASTCINYFVGMLVGESVALFGWNQYRCREILNSTRSIIAQNATGELYHTTVNYNGTVQTINRLPDVTLRPNCHKTIKQRKTFKRGLILYVLHGPMKPFGRRTNSTACLRIYIEMYLESPNKV